MTHHAKCLGTWISVPLALLLLTACASAPTVLTQVEIREVKVPVRTPMPDDCFLDHRTPRLDQEGTLTFREFDTWAEGLAQAIDRYRVQVARCRELNAQRQSEVLPEEP